MNEHSLHIGRLVYNWLSAPPRTGRYRSLPAEHHYMLHSYAPYSCTLVCRGLLVPPVPTNTDRYRCGQAVAISPSSLVRAPNITRV
jgi:hypothetical protein